MTHPLRLLWLCSALFVVLGLALVLFPAVLGGPGLNMKPRPRTTHSVVPSKSWRTGRVSLCLSWLPEGGLAPIPVPSHHTTPRVPHYSRLLA
ncbi:hypothetical protein KZ859_32625, partial [Pseudomonas aeruginosa]|nr:hypothetical protein [Pseudomonas aeruginosa]